MKLVLGGPKRSGKSCLRDALKRCIFRLSNGAIYPFCLRVNPDGDGAWYLGLAKRDANLADRLREPLKFTGGFTPEFIESRQRAVRQTELPLVLVDVGGYPWPDNEAICAGATHGLIIAQDQAVSEIPAWREFFKKLNIPVIAELVSDLHAPADRKTLSQGGIFCGSIHGLDRTKSADDRPFIDELSRHILEVGNLSQSNLEAKGGSSYRMEFGGVNDPFTILNVAFSPEAHDNDVRIPDALAQFEARLPQGGRLPGDGVLFDGPLSQPVAAALAVRAQASAAVVGIYDPDFDEFVVVWSSNPVYTAGTRIAHRETAPVGPDGVKPALNPSDLVHFKVLQKREYDLLECWPKVPHATKAELVSAAVGCLAGCTLRAGIPARISGGGPVTVAAALACAIGKGRPQIAVDDPAIGRFVVIAAAEGHAGPGTLLV